MQNVVRDVFAYRSGTGRSFGTFGELLQGVDKKGQDFLVTLPIHRFTKAKFLYDPNYPDLIVSPSAKIKAKKLAMIILNYFAIPARGFLQLEGNIPIGKGLASSSADLVATARAIDQCLELNLSPEQIQFFIKQVEPTDGVMYGGVVSFYHRKVELCEYLGQLPKLTIVGLDEGGEVNTIEYNKRLKPYSDEEKCEYDELLIRVSHAIRQGDLQQIGEVATRSTMLNQKLNPKKNFESVRSICDEVSGLGVVVAHSGTCLGILLNPESEMYSEQLCKAYADMCQLAGEVTVFHTWNDTNESW